MNFQGNYTNYQQTNRSPSESDSFRAPDANIPQNPMPYTGYPQNGANNGWYSSVPMQQYPQQTQTAPSNPQSVPFQDYGNRIPYGQRKQTESPYVLEQRSQRRLEEKARVRRRERPESNSGPSEVNWSASRKSREQNPPPPVPPSQNQEKKDDPKPRKKRNPLIIIALTIAVLAVIGIGVVLARSQSEYEEIKQAVEPYDNVFMDQVYVDGICLGGKTFEEGQKLINDHISLKKNGWYVRIRNEAGEYNDITADTLGINFDPSQALSDAWAVGRTTYSGMKETKDRYEELQKINAQEYHFSSAQQSASAAPIDTILNTLAAAAYREPEDAQYLGFDPDNTANPFSYQYEVYGQRLNIDGIKEQIMHYAEELECGEVLLTTEAIAPNVTVNDLCVAHELRAIAYTTISTHSTEDRTDNIRLAFSKINGLVLNDGAKFSFNSLVGKRSLENGFKAAVEYQYGKEEMGIGGGVCQASTTVYLAAANSGMTIKSRRPHSMAVSYTEYGLDCTVNDTKGHEIDFTFVNNSGAPIYICAHVIGNTKKNMKCEVRFYGQSLGDIKYSLIAETVEVLQKPFEPKTVEDKDGSYVTYTDQTKTIEGRDGYKVQSYLVTYQNGVEVSRKEMYLDTYPSKADTIYVGVTPR